MTRAVPLPWLHYVTFATSANFVPYQDSAQKTTKSIWIRLNTHPEIDMMGTIFEPRIFGFRNFCVLLFGGRLKGHHHEKDYPWNFCEQFDLRSRARYYLSNQQACPGKTEANRPIQRYRLLHLECNLISSISNLNWCSGSPGLCHVPFQRDQEIKIGANYRWNRGL